MSIADRVWEHLENARELALEKWDTLDKFYEAHDSLFYLRAFMRPFIPMGIAVPQHVAQFEIEPTVYNLDSLKRALGTSKSNLTGHQIEFSEQREGQLDPFRSMLGKVTGRGRPRYHINIDGKPLQVIDHDVSQSLMFRDIKGRDIILSVNNSNPTMIRFNMNEPEKELHPYLKSTLDYVLDEKHVLSDGPTGI